MKEKTITVTKENGKDINLVIKQPGTGANQRAQRVHVKTWTDCIKDGIMTKRELGKMMREKGIWSEEKEKQQLDLMREIADLEKKLYLKNGRSSKFKVSEGKDIAIQIRGLRLLVRTLIADKIALEQNTAEALADNARFDFLVSACTYYENGEKVYNTLEDYNNAADSEVAYGAAAALAEMLYDLDQDVDSKLPENKFLKTFGFVDDNLALVDTEGHRVDLEGRRINDLGQFVDEEGHRTDKDGNPLDEEGNYIPSVTYVDDKGKKVDPNG